MQLSVTRNFQTSVLINFVLKSSHSQSHGEIVEVTAPHSHVAILVSSTQESPARKRQVWKGDAVHNDPPMVFCKLRRKSQLLSFQVHPPGTLSRLNALCPLRCKRFGERSRRASTPCRRRSKRFYSALRRSGWGPGWIKSWRCSSGRGMTRWGRGSGWSVSGALIRTQSANCCPPLGARCFPGVCRKVACLGLRRKRRKLLR